MKKVWKIKNKGSFTDDEIISAIKEGKVIGEDLIIADMFDDYIKVDDSIYQFYLKGNSNETI